MRRLALLLLLLPALAACGDSGGDTTTVTTTQTEPTPTDTTGATEPEPPPQAKGERIEIEDFFAFETPSGRIGCAATKEPSTLRCDTAFRTRFSGTETCEAGDFGQAFMLAREGEGRPICAGDTVLSANDARTIPYGATWLLGPYTCTSRQSGLMCRNEDGGGFSLSRESQRVF